MSIWITICDTCKRDDWLKRGLEKTDGEILGALIRAHIKASGVKNYGLIVRHHSCLMSCQRACSVSLQAQGKLSYLLGNFEPDARSALAIVEYACAYSQSRSGQVPFKSWPEDIKGHFVGRIPPTISTGFEK